MNNVAAALPRKSLTPVEREFLKQGNRMLLNQSNGRIGGYFGAAELMGWAWTQTAGFSAFVCGALCVVTFSGLLEWMQTGQMPRWLQWVFRLRARKEG